MEDPLLTVVVLAWDQLHHTEPCVRSIRANTDVPYELVIVDNGSAPLAARFAVESADHAVCNERNLGFAAGMNQGLDVARGEYVAFVNNDTVLPSRWASSLLEVFRDRPEAGIVVPAVTTALNNANVRNTPGSQVKVLPAFGIPPSAVLYVLRRDVAVRIGGWGEEFPIASAEDMDLCFKVWVNNLEVVFDSRVLVDHVGKGTAGEKLSDWEALWAANRRILIEKWLDDDVHVPRLDSCTPEEYSRNLRIARSVAMWMDRYFAAREAPWWRVLLRSLPLVSAVAQHVRAARHRLRRGLGSRRIGPVGPGD